jgi:hypothetical protein
MQENTRFRVAGCFVAGKRCYEISTPGSGRVMRLDIKRPTMTLLWARPLNVPERHNVNRSVLPFRSLGLALIHRSILDFDDWLG